MTEIRQSHDAFAMFGLVVAVLFSLIYVTMYPMLIGGSMIYWHPAWSGAAAAVYVALGILVQALFCWFRGREGTLTSLLVQAGAGGLYLFLSLVHGEPYQS